MNQFEGFTPAAVRIIGDEEGREREGQFPRLVFMIDHLKNEGEKASAGHYPVAKYIRGLYRDGFGEPVPDVEERNNCVSTLEAITRALNNAGKDFALFVHLEDAGDAELVEAVEVASAEDKNAKATEMVTALVSALEEHDRRNGWRAPQR